MNFRVVKEALQRYKNIHSLCKSIELVTILTLKIFKNKIFSSREITKLLFCFLKEKYDENVSDLYHLIIPFLTDKSCSGIINNSLWTAVKEVLSLLAYQNIAIHIFGTSMKFKKNINMSSSNTAVIGNLYSLSDETVSYYLSYILFKELVFIDSNYFYIYFNEYISLYYQVVNYYLLRSLNEFIYIFFLNECTFSIIDYKLLQNIYFFLITVLLLDILEFNMYSELGSRANSMTNSIQSSKDNVKIYSLLHNRFRQAKITNEIIEIISSSNI